MTGKLAGIINYLIGAFLLLYILFILRQKNNENPQMKIYGQSIRTLFIIIFAGIIIDIILIVATLLK